MPKSWIFFHSCYLNHVCVMKAWQKYRYFGKVFLKLGLECWSLCAYMPPHYYDVIMGAIASQITSLTTVYSTIYSDADQRKHQSSAPLAFVRGIHRGPVNSPHKWPVMWKMLPFDESSWNLALIVSGGSLLSALHQAITWCHAWSKSLMCSEKFIEILILL